jgi:hypothetical protein
LKTREEKLLIKENESLVAASANTQQDSPLSFD